MLLTTDMEYRKLDIPNINGTSEFQEFFTEFLMHIIRPSFVQIEIREQYQKLYNVCMRDVTSIRGFHTLPNERDKTILVQEDFYLTMKQLLTYVDGGETRLISGIRVNLLIDEELDMNSVSYIWEGTTMYRYKFGMEITKGEDKLSICLIAAAHCIDQNDEQSDSIIVRMNALQEALRRHSISSALGDYAPIVQMVDDLKDIDASKLRPPYFPL